MNAGRATFKWRALVVLLAAGCGYGCGAESAPGTAPVSRIALHTHPDGRIDIVASNGRMIVRGAWAEALVADGEQQRALSTTACLGDWQPQASLPNVGSYFAAASGWRWRCDSGGIVLDWLLVVDAAHDTVLTHLEVGNSTGGELVVLRTTPLISTGADGGLFIANDPKRLRILDDGSNIAGEVDAKLHYVDEPRNALLDVLLPIASRGNVLSNWNHAVLDLDSGRSWIAGALTVEHAFPTMGVRPSLPPASSVELIADDALLFRGKRIAAGDSVESEWLYCDPLSADVFSGLERYADAIAAWQGITPWTRRGGGRPVPTGWNSWTGSAFSGGLGTDIDEQSMGENLDVMARELAPFGVDYFQVDDGWQRAAGDWDADPERFPAGMAAWSERVKARHLIPGLWISAFSVDESSHLFAEHPEWLARQRDNALGPLLAPNAGTRVLDLHNDDAIAWVGDTFRRFKEDWDLGWVKLDFAYLALPYAPPGASLTSIEAYKRAIRSVREAVGEDVFYLGIAMMGLNWGVVDGMRLTLDSAPRWEEDDPFALLGADNSFKATVRTGARRYYFHNRVWISHNDLLFFRTDTGQPQPVVTIDEAKTFASFIGMSGSIVKFGEDLRTLTPEQIQVWRQLLPIYPRTARPLDLFRRMYPEQWLLDVDPMLAGGDMSWKVLALLNWGRNFDYSADSVVEIPDQEREYTLAVENLGLDPEGEYLAQEFWSETFLGVVSGEFRRSVPPHRGELITLRRATGHPQLVGSNRHFTQGGTDLLLESWDEQRGSLTLRFDLDQGGADAVPFEYRWQVYVPNGYALVAASTAGAVLRQAGPIVMLSLTPRSPGPVTIDLRFAPPAESSRS